MAQYTASTLRRGQSGVGAFAIAEYTDLKLSDTIAVDLTGRNAIEDWRRTPHMACYVISEDKTYRLGADVTIVGQVWTEVVYSDPDALVYDDVFGVDGYIKPELLRNLFINDSFVVDSEAAMLAVTSVIGNVFVRTDTGGVFLKLNNDDPSDISDFADITADTGAVTSVNGMTGAVSVTIANLLAVPANLTAFNSAVTSSTTVASHTASIASLTSNKADLVSGTVPLAQLPYLFDNGLTLTGSEVTLGGDLLYDTLIALKAFNLKIVKDGVGKFGIDLGSDDAYDLLYRGTDGYFNRLAKGSDGQVLKINAGALAWLPDSGGGGGSVSWGGILGTVTDQTDLVTYLNDNFISSLSDGSGLTFDTDHYDLGGTVTGDTLVNGVYDGVTDIGIFFKIENESDPTIYSEIGVVSDSGSGVGSLVRFSSRQSPGGGIDTVFTIGDSFGGAVVSTDLGSGEGTQVDLSGLIVSDNRSSPAGLQYAGDYNSTLVTNSLTPVSYVLGAKSYSDKQTFYGPKGVSFPVSGGTPSGVQDYDFWNDNGHLFFRSGSINYQIDRQAINKVDKGGDTMTGFLVLSADPTIALHAATKSYVDNIITGLTWKGEVVTSTSANITLSGEQTIDGVLTSTSRVLVKNQTTQSENGIYVSAAGAWTRSTDADTGVELAGATVLVAGGSTRANTQWTCSNTTITIGSTSVTFVQIAGAGTYTSGTGITLTGNVFSITTNGVGASQFRQSAALSLVGNPTNATANVDDIVAGSDGNILRRNGTALAFGSIDLSLAAAVGTTRLAYSNLAQSSALSVLGVTGNATANLASIAAGTDGNVLRRSGTSLAFGSIDLAAAGAVGSSILAIGNGGTGSAAQNFVDLTTAQTIAGKKSFTATSTLASINLSSIAGNPSSLSNNDIWVNTTAGHLGFQISGSINYAMRTAATASGFSIPYVTASSSSFYSHSGFFTFNGTTFSISGLTTLAANTSAIQTTGALTFRATSADVINLHNSNNTITTGATNQVLNAFLHKVSYTASHTGLNVNGFIHDPTIAGTQTGSVVNRAFAASSGQFVMGSLTLTAGAIMDLQSTVMGFSPPKMTTTQRDSITGFDGLYVHNLTTHTLDFHNGTLWSSVFASAGDRLGTSTNNSAAAGYIGEEIKSVISSFANYTTTATFQNVTSISLTAGDWDVSAMLTLAGNGATVSASPVTIATSTTTAATDAHTVSGVNIYYIPTYLPSPIGGVSGSIPPYRVSLASTTTIYFITQATFTIGNPQYAGSIRARRMR